MRRALSLMTIALLVSACGGGSEGTSPISAPTSAAADTSAAGEPSTAAGPATAATDETASSTDATAAEAAATAEGGTCTIRISGDLEEEVEYPQHPIAISTDHWLTEEQLRESAEFLEVSYEEITARDDPVLTWLMVTCGPDPLGDSSTDQEGPAVMVMASDGTKGSQMPMGPGTYAVAGNLLDSDREPGTVGVGFDYSDEEFFHALAGSGELVITTWDDEAIEGTVTFDITEAFTDEPRRATVQMDFSFTCAAATAHSGCG